MKCQILFSGKNKKTIVNLSSALIAQRVVEVNMMRAAEDFHNHYYVVRKPSKWITVDNVTDREVMCLKYCKDCRFRFL